jgi:hypothetical protein
MGPWARRAGAREKRRIKDKRADPIVLGMGSSFRRKGPKALDGLGGKGS